MKQKSKISSTFNSIRTRILIIMLLICIVPVAVLGIVSYNKAYSILADKLKVSSAENLASINKGFDNYFRGLNNQIGALATNYDFEQIIAHPEYEQFALGLLENVAQNNSDIKAVYMGTSTKKMIIYPVQTLPSNYDPTTRPWYTKAIESPGKIVYSEPYKDTSSEGNGNLVVSVSRTVQDGDKIVGVLSMDIDLSVLSQQVSNAKVGNNGYVYLTDTNGIMIAHKDKSLVGSDTVLKIEGNFWKNANIKSSGFIEYKYNGNKKFASFDTNASTGWKIFASLEEKELSADTNVIRNLAVMVSIGIALLALIISIFVAKSITKHLFHLKDLFEKAAEGDLSVKVNIQSKDEFSHLADSFNKMLNNIGALIGNVKKSADTIASTSQSIATMSSETTRAISEVALTIDQVATGTTSQAQDINDGAESMNVLAEKIEHIDRLAEEINSISNDTSKLSEDGLLVMNTLTSKTEEVNKSTMEVSQVVGEMQKSSEEISVITDTINNISAQTNLLALNAAIEAARAGEAGRGFSVVADEIRKLAEQSSDATKQIQNLIELIKGKSLEAVKSMDSAKAVVMDQTAAVSETKEKFTMILDSIRVLMKEIKEVQASVQETDISKDEIVGRMQNISAVAEENSASTEEVSASTEEVTASMQEFDNSAKELKELAKKLEEEINKFKLS